MLGLTCWEGVWASLTISYQLKFWDKYWYNSEQDKLIFGTHDIFSSLFSVYKF
jgi:hypothetical protein